ncbi:MAG: hypothetical protein HQ515_06420 [Phycisphaeraceae bacterium]|nr:hypothetical protein [Phycisphaeraceae bacterium]
MADIDMKALENKAWKSTHEDGLVDIIIGILLVSFAIMPFIEAMIGRWYILIAVPVPVIFASLLIYYGKGHITAPRMGVAKFGPDRQAAKTKSVRLSILTLIVLVTLVALTALGKFTDVFGGGLSGLKVPLAIAIGVVILMSVKARLLGIPRLQVYGFVIGIGVLSVEVLRNLVGRPWHSVISWGLPGLCILFYGIRMLTTFTKKYPLPSEGHE